MENLKIRVNGEAESKEAQELFFELGYKWFSGGNQVQHLKHSCSSSFGYLVAWSTGCFTDVIQCGCGNEDAKEITIQKLRDLVVLKRNSIDDATHEDKNDPEFKYRLIDNHWYVITEGNPVWRKDSIDLNEAPLFIKPIEKLMKEYLRKNSNGTYSYIGTVRPEHVSDFMIEIPEGANYAYNNDQGLCFLSGSLGDNHPLLIWQRHTLPEELPFIDDEPKEYLREDANGSYILELTCKQEATEPHAKHWIEVPVGVNFYYSFASGDKVFTKEHSSLGRLLWQRKPPFSINDQYEEIEKVRQSHRTASEIADSALKHIRERAETYDQPTGERSAAKTAKAFNAITGKDITESEVWLLLQLLKDVRQWSREDYHQDSAEDCIAYAALKAESLEGGE